MNDDPLLHNLHALERMARELALVALCAWQRVDPFAEPAHRKVLSARYFSAIAALQRPSWGHWNGLLAEIREARRLVLEEASPAWRKALEASAPLTRVLALAEQALPREMVETYKAICRLANHAPSRRPAWAQMLVAAGGVRNRVHHDLTLEPAWRAQATELTAAALRGAREAFEREGVAGLPRSGPWFEADEAGATSVFNGVGKSDIMRDPPRPGRPEAYGEFLAAVASLFGEKHVNERELRALLARLAPDDAVGVLVGEFLVLAPVGEGATAKVHRAIHLSTGRRVALKMLRADADDDLRERFREEAACLGALSHRNVVSVLGHYECPVTPARPEVASIPWVREFVAGVAWRQFIAMEWVEGRTLEAVFAEAAKPGAPALAERVEWFAQTAEALAAVHGAGFVHRDVKPANVMLDLTGQIKLMDFGIARTSHEARTRRTETGKVVGTLAYMSPEQIASAAHGAVGPASDVFSLCATFFELLTGERLRGALDAVDDREALLARLRAVDRRAAEAAAARLPWQLRRLVLGGLEEAPRDRPRSAEALAEDLRRVLRDEPILYRPPSLARRVALAWRRNRVVAWLSTGFLTAFALGVAAYLVATTHARLRAEAGERDARRALLLARAEPLIERDPAGAARDILGAMRLGVTPEVERVARQWSRRRTVFSLGSHVPGAQDVDWSHDGRWIATVGNDSVLRVWDGARYAPLRDVRVDTSADGLVGLARVRFSPDGALVAVGGEGGRLAVVRRGDGRVVGSRRDHGAPLTALAWRGDGAELFSIDARGVVVRSRTSDGAPVAPEGASLGLPEGVRCPPFAWSCTAEERLLNGEAFTQRASDIAVAPSGALVAWVDASAAVAVLDLDAEPRVVRHALPSVGHAVTWLSEGVLAVGSLDGTLRVMTEDGAPFGVAGAFPAAPAGVRRLRVGGGVLAVGCVDGTVAFYDSALGSAGMAVPHLGGEGAPLSIPRIRVLPAIKTQSVVAGLAWSPDGEHLLTVSALERSARLARVEPAVTETIVSAMRAASGFRPPIIERRRPGHPQVAGVRVDGSLALYDASTWDEQLVCPGATNRNAVPAWSPDGRWLVTSAASGRLQIWRVADGCSLARESPAALHTTMEVRWNPDGRSFVVGEAGGPPLRFEEAAGQWTYRALPRWAGVSALDWDASGRMLVGVQAATSKVLVGGLDDAPRAITTVPTGHWQATRHPTRSATLLHQHDGRLALVDHAAGRVVWGANLAGEGSFTHIAWNRSGDRLGALSVGGWLYVLDGATGAVLDRAPTSLLVSTSFEWEPDDRSAQVLGASLGALVARVPFRPIEQVRGELEGVRPHLHDVTTFYATLPDPERLAAFGMRIEGGREGARVVSVEPGGAAASAGVLPGDVLTARGDAPLADLPTSLVWANLSLCDAALPLTLRRAGRPLSVDLPCADALASPPR